MARIRLNDLHELKLKKRSEKIKDLESNRDSSVFINTNDANF